MKKYTKITIILLVLAYFIIGAITTGCSTVTYPCSTYRGSYGSVAPKANTNKKAHKKMRASVNTKIVKI